MHHHDDTTGDTNLTPAELANRWHTSTGRLANLRSDGRGPRFWKLGASVLYRLVDIWEFEANCVVDTAGSATGVSTAA